ncbi:MAG: VPDSG-CTERM sorting domain-containing protein [Opitutaceae bacterium]|jgi:hypothetical protein
MFKTIKKVTVTAIGLYLLSSVALKADPVTVQEVGVGANEIVTITSSTLGTATVYSGVLDLLVNGTSTEGFCIDPWHWSASGPEAYSTESLSNAPKPAVGSTANPMGVTTATEIEQLWQNYYTPAISDTTAAALQIEIWELVDAAVTTGTFTLDSAPGTVLSTLATMQTWLADNPGAPVAPLIAVTGPGQDYVIPIPAVPDSGSTVALVGLGVIGLVAFRKKLSTRS